MSEQATSTQAQEGDNLMGMLNTFNNGSPEQQVESETEEQKVQQPEEQQAEPEESKENLESEEEAVEQVKQWLIDNKFEDTEEGREKLADAYKNIQSAKDKAESELRDKSTKYEKLEVLDDWLKKNPQIIDLLEQEAQKQESSGPPAKPEDYDLMEEQVEGSTSQQWRLEYDQWLIDQGAKKAMNQFEGIRQKENVEKQRQAEVNELKSLGMTDEEIQSFYGFMKSPENVTTQNMVKVWKVLNNKEDNAQSTSKEKEVKDSKVLKMEKVQSGASIEGKAPPVKKPADKEIDEFMKGIMQFSKK
jgi:hypothetical protein